MAKVEIDQSASGTTLRVAPGDEVELTLPETRTGGYAWQLGSTASKSFSVEDLGFTRAPAVGGTGTRRWRVVAQQAGTGTVELTYGRSWEQSSAPKKFTVTIEVS